MRIKSLIVALAALVLSTGETFAQVKIGYTNIELLLAYMPETEQMNKDLQVYAKKLDQELQIESNYYQLKESEYIQLSKAGKLTPADDEKRQIELMRLDSTLRRKQAIQEQQLMAMQQELIQPSLEKLQNAIDEVSKAEGYTYILNQSTSSGVSTILFGPDTDDITERIMKKLGIEIPAEFKPKEKEKEATPKTE